MKSSLVKLLTCVFIGALSAPAFAAPIQISSYDVPGLPHGDLPYTGSVTEVEHNYTYDGDTYTYYTYNYSGGTGPMIDGSWAEAGAENYFVYNAFNGTNSYNDYSTITLHFGEMAKVSSFSLFGNQSVPDVMTGNIAGVNVTINGQTHYIAAQGFGPGNTRVEFIHGLFDLTGSGLEDLVTDQIILSGFVSKETYDFFTITQVTVDGIVQSAGVVPEPQGLALLAMGMMGLGMMRRRRSK